MEDTKENNNAQQNMLEKKIIVDLIILTITLFYVSLFFIYDIVDIGAINTSQTTVIDKPDDIPPVIDDGIATANKNIGQSVVENKARLRILEGTTEWNELLKLDVFNSENIHVTKGKIAPGVHGIYSFTVENYGEIAVRYALDFTEENPYNINMVYKLKYNGNYVAGNESTWVKFADLTQSNLTINTNKIDLFELEWAWQDAENDTEIGRTEGANYQVNILATGEAINN